MYLFCKKLGFLQIDLQIIGSSFRICKSICNHHDSTSRFCELVCTHIDSRSQRTQPRPRARHRPAPLAHGPMGPIGPTGSMRPMGPWQHGPWGPWAPWANDIHTYIYYICICISYLPKICILLHPWNQNKNKNNSKINQSGINSSQGREKAGIKQEPNKYQK